MRNPSALARGQSPGSKRLELVGDEPVDRVVLVVRDARGEEVDLTVVHEGDGGGLVDELTVELRPEGRGCG